ncbi:MAG: hypothetical protein M4579_005486 [Chaenotheca gracillima]|nr:MAG: hypothetical protein M4579_005486 [Chaenotheca gracillima]
MGSQPKASVSPAKNPLSSRHIRLGGSSSLDGYKSSPANHDSQNVVDAVCAKAKTLERRMAENKASSPTIYKNGTGTVHEHPRKSPVQRLPSKEKQDKENKALDSPRVDLGTRKLFEKAFEVFKKSLSDYWDSGASIPFQGYVDYLETQVFPYIKIALLTYTEALTADTVIRVGVQTLTTIAIRDYEQRSYGHIYIESAETRRQLAQDLVLDNLCQKHPNENGVTDERHPPKTSTPLAVNNNGSEIFRNNDNKKATRLSRSPSAERSRQRSDSSRSASSKTTEVQKARPATNLISRPLNFIQIDSDSEDSNDTGLVFNTMAGSSGRTTRKGGPAAKRKRSPTSRRPRPSTVAPAAAASLGLEEPMTKAAKQDEATQRSDSFVVKTARQLRSRNFRVLAGLTDDMVRPYISVSQREGFQRALGGQSENQTSIRWNGQVVHIDFSEEEIDTLLPSVLAEQPVSSDAGRSVGDSTARVFALLQTVGDDQVRRMAEHARRMDDERPSARLYRQIPGIELFLREARAGILSGPTGFLHLGRPRPLKAPDFPIPPRKRLTHQREIGNPDGRRGCTSRKSIFEQTKLRLYDSMGAWRTWPSGGSGDVVTVAWGSDGETFAAGCAALTDPDNMQYNKANNLLWGSIPQNLIAELSEHRRPRHRPDTGPNSTNAIINTMDPWLYYTISSMECSPTTGHLLTASYDHTVKVWDISTSSLQPSLVSTLAHDSIVDIVTASRYDGLFATGSQSIKNGVRVYKMEDGQDEPVLITMYTSPCAQRYPEKQISPSSLRWGKHPWVQTYLLGGYSANDESKGKDPQLGDLCVWDVSNPQPTSLDISPQNVFDCVWQPTLPQFAVGCVADEPDNSEILSCLQLYSGQEGKFVKVRQLDCPALDMNEVTWCEDEIYCTASCTDGMTYVWDARSPNRILHRLEHGNPIQTIPENRRRDEADTGVKFAQWGESPSRFYTGSSDGVVKSWNIKLATEDTLVRDVAQFDAGVMCGSFSSDFSRLLIGDASGGVHVLSVAVDKNDEDDRVQNFNYEGAAPPSNQILPSQQRREQDDEEEPAENPFMVGILEARARLASGQMRIDYSTGRGQAVKGPNYDGPFANDTKPANTYSRRRQYRRSMSTSGSDDELGGSDDEKPTMTPRQNTQTSDTGGSRFGITKLAGPVVDLSEASDGDIEMEDPISDAAGNTKLPPRVKTGKRSLASSGPATQKHASPSQSYHEDDESSELDVEDAYQFDIGIFP